MYMEEIDMETWITILACLVMLGTVVFWYIETYHPDFF